GWPDIISRRDFRREGLGSQVTKGIKAYNCIRIKPAWIRFYIIGINKIREVRAVVLWDSLRGKGCRPRDGIRSAISADAIFWSASLSGAYKRPTRSGVFGPPLNLGNAFFC